MRGLSKTRLYKIYSGMKQRCFNPNVNNYKYYGGKGIAICEEWMGDNGLQRFIEWSLDNGYDETLSIDRVDSNRDYSPQNCRWLPMELNSSRSAHSRRGAIVKGIIPQKIRMALAYKNMSEAALARALGIAPQNLNRKMKTEKCSSSELEEIAAVLGANFYTYFEFPDGTKI